MPNEKSQGHGIYSRGETLSDRRTQRSATARSLAKLTEIYFRYSRRMRNCQSRPAFRKAPATLKYHRRDSAVKKSSGSALLIATRTSDEFLRKIDKVRTRIGKRETERERKLGNDRQETRNRWVDNGEKKENGMRRKKKREREDRRAREIYSARIRAVDIIAHRFSARAPSRALISRPRRGNGRMGRSVKSAISEATYRADDAFESTTIATLITLASSSSRRSRLDRRRFIADLARGDPEGFYVLASRFINVRFSGNAHT